MNAQSKIRNGRYSNKTFPTELESNPYLRYFYAVDMYILILMRPLLCNQPQAEPKSGRK